jgi:hypothetical protein
MENDENIKLEYIKRLREDFTGNYIEIIFNKEKDVFTRIYFYDSKHGTLEYLNGIKKVHRWEDEDEAQSGSYLNRRYTSILLDGIISDPVREERIIESTYTFIKEINVKKAEMEIISKAIGIVKNTRPPSMPND